LLIASLVGMLARHIRLPYTLALVLAGLGLSFVQLGALNDLALTPELLLLLFLPPLLFEAAYHLPFDDLRQNAPLQALRRITRSNSGRVPRERSIKRQTASSCAYLPAQGPPVRPRRQIREGLRDRRAHPRAEGIPRARHPAPGSAAPTSAAELSSRRLNGSRDRLRKPRKKGYQSEKYGCTCNYIIPYECPLRDPEAPRADTRRCARPSAEEGQTVQGGVRIDERRFADREPGKRSAQSVWQRSHRWRAIVECFGPDVPSACNLQRVDSGDDRVLPHPTSRHSPRIEKER
jgi:sodium/hydrogen exchanger family protein